MRRLTYTGNYGELKAISPEKARAIVKFVGGDPGNAGTVAIAKGDQLLESPQFASAGV